MVDGVNGGEGRLGAGRARGDVGYGIGRSGCVV